MEEKRKSKIFSGKIGRIIIAIIVLAFTCVLAIVVTTAMKDSFKSGVPDDVVKAVLSSEDELAYSIDSDSIVAIRPFGNGIVLLSDTAVTYVNKNGEISAEDTHTLISPAMNVMGSRVILYSRLSDSFRIEKNCRTEQQLSASAAILTCAVGKNGNYAVCTYNDNGFASRLKVYDREDKLIYEWGCALDYITAVALSDNGKYVAVAVTGAENAESYSKVFLFDFDYNAEKYFVTLPDEAAYAVSFLDKKTIIACTDKSVHKIDFEGKDELLLTCVVGQILRSDVCHRGMSVFCSSDTTDISGNSLHIFDKKGKETAVVQLTDDILTVSCSDKYAAVAFNDRVELYNADGELCKTITTDLSCVRAVISNRSVYILCVNGIVVCPVD